MIDISHSLSDLTADLVAINSVSGNEREICDKIEEVFVKNDLIIARIGNSVAARLDLQKEKTVALVGHLDTVPLSRKNQTNPAIKDGNLVGLGSCDMKSGIACALKILCDVKNGEISPKYNLVFVFYEGEETMLPNGITRLLAEKKLENIDFAFVLEPTSSKYSVGCLGSLMAKIAIPGISAHSANPVTGKNALSEAAKIIQKVEKIDSELKKPQEINGLWFYETINVTQLTTENATNVIPQKANMTINFRFSPNKTVEEAKEFLFSIVDENLLYHIDCEDSCLTPIDKAESFLQSGIEREIMQAWTDIAQLNAANIPAINFGAGDIKMCHKPDEFVNINELNEFYELLREHI